MLRDTITLNAFDHQEMRNGLLAFVRDRDGHEHRLESGDPQVWAFLFFQLREAEDRPEWFPKGKWSTIQKLETLLIECTYW